MEESKIDRKIDSKLKALQRLTDELNAAEDVTAKTIADLDAFVARKKEETYKAVAEWERKVSDTELSVKLIRKDLLTKESELIDWKKELDNFSKSLDEVEAIQAEKEGLIVEKEQELFELWANFVQSANKHLVDESKSIKRRSETLEKQANLLNRRRDALFDQIKTFKASRREVLNK